MWFGKRRALPVVEVETIPHEIWHHILLYAGIKAAASMRLVSSTMNQISVDDFLWKQFAIRFQYEKVRSPLRTELNEITFPSGVTPSWFEYCKMLMSKPARKVLLKIILLGDISTGKTSLSTRFNNGSFSATYRPTIGSDFGTKQITVGGTPVTLQIWDTAGPERFRSLSCAFYRGSDGALLVADLSSPMPTLQCWDMLSRWRNDFIEAVETSEIIGEKVPIVVVGNKEDLIDREENSAQMQYETEIKTWCEENNCVYFPTSAKTGKNVEEAFRSLAEQGMQWMEPTIINNLWDDKIVLTQPRSACYC